MSARNRVNTAGRQYAFVFFLLIFLAALSQPSLLRAANWSVDMTAGNTFSTVSSLDPFDSGSNNVTINAGDTITFNLIGGGHTATSSNGTGPGACSGGNLFNSGTLTSGSFTTPPLTGTTPSGSPCVFYCEIHGSPGGGGMAGTIIVLPAPMLTVTKSGTGTGTVTSSPAGIDCGSTCTAPFTGSVTLSATPDAGVTFGGFSGGGCSGTATTCTLTMTADTTVTANFKGAGGGGGGGGGSGDSQVTGFFDLDSNPDLVVASASTKKIKLYPMTAAGTFAGGNPPVPSFSMTDTNTPIDITAGNLNSLTDPNDDIAVLDDMGDGTFGIAIYYGNRSGGNFHTDGSGNAVPDKLLMVPKANGTPDTVTSIVARDVNGDGKGDLIVTLPPATTGAEPQPKIFLGNGDGTFQGMIPYSNAPVVATITVAPASATIVVGQPQLYKATALDALGNIISGVTFTWSSDNSGVCSVDSTGLAKGISAGGPATISASSGAVTGSATCTVNPATQDITAISMTATVSGSNIIISDTIYNSGVGTIPSFYVGYFLTPASGPDIYIGRRSVSSLAQASYNSASSTFAMKNIPTGTYTAKMVADYTNQIYESNENNNTLSSAGSYLLGPDLLVNPLSVSLSGMSFYISDTEVNSGSQPAGGFTVSFYLSSGTSPSGSDIPIGIRSLIGLAGGGATDSATTIFTVPATAPPGFYHVCAVTDSGGVVTETNEGNNFKCTAGTYSVGPDLIVYNGSVTVSGTQIYLSDTEMNTGSQNAGPFTVAYYFSTTPAYTSTSILIGTRSLTGLAGASGNNSATTVFSISPTVPLGSYYVIMVSDSANTVSEINETNNNFTSPAAYQIGPDLRVYGISVTKSGGSLYVSDTEINSGSEPAGPFQVSFYLSTDKTLSGSDILIGSRSLGGLAGGSATSSATTILTPSGVPAGSYYVIGVSDSGGAVSEINESNNVLSTAGTVTLP